MRTITDPFTARIQEKLSPQWQAQHARMLTNEQKAASWEAIQQTTRIREDENVHKLATLAPKDQRAHFETKYGAAWETMLVETRALARRRDQNRHQPINRPQREHAIRERIIETTPHAARRERTKVGGAATSDDSGGDADPDPAAEGDPNARLSAVRQDGAP